MDINLLRTFLEVARLRHFGKAADKVFLTQSAVSARIKQLEEIIGAPLFVRKRNDIQLTEAGRRLAVKAEIIVREWETARRELATLSDTGMPVRSIGFLHDLWPLLMRDWLAGCSDNATTEVMNLQSLGSAQLAQGVVSGDLDLALMFECPHHAGLKITEVAGVELLLVATRVGKIEEVEQYLYVDWGARFSEWHDQQNLPLPPPAFLFSSGRFALDHLLAAGGAAFLPRRLVQGELAHGRLFELAADSFQRSINLVYRRSHADIDAVMRLAGELASRFTDSND